LLCLWVCLYLCEFRFFMCRRKSKVSRQLKHRSWAWDAVWMWLLLLSGVYFPSWLSDLHSPSLCYTLLFSLPFSWKTNGHNKFVILFEVAEKATTCSSWSVRTRLRYLCSLLNRKAKTTSTCLDFPQTKTKTIYLVTLRKCLSEKCIRYRPMEDHKLMSEVSLRMPNFLNSQWTCFQRFETN